MNKKIKLKGRLKSYLQASIFLGILLIFIDVSIYLLDVKSGLLLTAFLIFYFAITITLLFYNRPVIVNELINFATQ